jgi:hypothetical protein
MMSTFPPWKKKNQNQNQTRWSILFFLAISFMLVSFQIRSSTNIAIPRVDSVDYYSPPTTTTITRSQSLTVSLSKQVLAHKEEEKGGSFSACLLIMDDNHFLIEWLAYHWHILPLRRLIVAVDPRSRFSPTPILDRYQQLGLMEITEWTDKDFMIHLYVNVTQKDLAAAYMQRQLEFYSKCTARLHQEGRSWVLFTDSDEFVTPNSHAAPQVRIDNNRTNANTSSLLLQQLQQVQKANVSRMMSSPCVVLPRLRFGTKASNALETQLLVPLPFRGQEFMTLRWRWRAKSAFGKITLNPHNGVPKCMVNLQYVQDSMIHYDGTAQNSVDRVVNPHRPVKALCPEDDLRTMHRDASFVVHHYPGTLEQWTFRDDGRADARSPEAYQGLAKRARKLDDSIRPWLQELVRAHGEDLAQLLLEGVGQVSSNHMAFDATTTTTGMEKKGH